MSKPQIFNNSEIFKDFYGCKFVLTAKHQNIIIDQRHFRIEKSLSQKSSTSRKYSKTFSPVKLSWPQKNISFRIIQNRFFLQICLNRNLSESRKYSQTFSPGKISRPQIIYISEIFKDVFTSKIVLIANHQNPGKIHRLFRLEICLIRKSSKPRTSSKTVLPGKMALPQIIDSPGIVKDFFGWKNLSAANHLYLGVIHGSFHLQKFLNLNHYYP